MKPKRERDRKEATFLEHLEELRQRLIRCFIYVVVAAALCWGFKKPLMQVAQAPIRQAAEMKGVEVDFRIFTVAGGLVLALQIAGVAGVILASPAWLMEAWLFIEPALEDHERKWVVPLLPAAVILFLIGVVFCYWLSPRAFAVLLGFHQQLGIVKPELILPDYLVFFLRLILVFGLMFELPLVIMFLAAVGLVKSEWLAQYWRIAVVVIAVVCAIVTPTPDAVTLSFLAVPMVGLYVLSIYLARLVEKGRRKARETDSARPEAEVETAPADDPTPPEDGYYDEYEDYADTDPLPGTPIPQGEGQQQAPTAEEPGGDGDEATAPDPTATDLEQFGDPYQGLHDGRSSAETAADAESAADERPADDDGGGDRRLEEP